jgi:AcrR family transcriptional regulator
MALQAEAGTSPAQTNGSPTPLTARGQRTRSSLIRAAASVFERDGFVDSRITDIARVAGVATGTFYKYFESKDAIFWEVVDEIISELYEQSHVGDTAGADPAARIAAANRLYIESFARHAALYAVVVQVASFNVEFRNRRQASRLIFLERAARGLKQLQSNGRADQNLNAELTAALLCGMVENFAEIHHAFHFSFKSADAIEAMTDIWCRAIQLH